jgi:Zn-dependent protease with chaperone function
VTSTLVPATVAAAAVALAAPHLVPLRHARPLPAIAVWLSALALRALLAIAIATAAMAALTTLEPLRAALDWCWHEVLPDLPAALGFAEHPVTHAAVTVPLLALVTSLLCWFVRWALAWLELRRQLSAALGPGPLGSTVVHDDRVLLAVTGCGRARVIVSDRALGELDEEELRAGLIHEHAHILRRHRPILLAGAALAALARPLPGTAAALRELRLQVERDADQYTVRTTRDPLALASAICKAAVVPERGAIASLGGQGRVRSRLIELLEGPPAAGRALRVGSWTLVVGLVCVSVALLASAPAWALNPEGVEPVHDHGCNHADRGA